MPLADMLSAMRGVILDGLLLPHTSEEREQTLQKHFPGLSTLETQDLSRIEPEKFAIYTGTIFRGEAGLLQRLFPMTFALLQDAWSNCYGETFNAFRFTQQLHKARPWKSSATVGLASAFVLYLSQDLPEMLAVNPALPEVSKFEFTSLRVQRAIDENRNATISISAIQSYTVKELMSLAVAIAAPTEVLSVGFNLLDARIHFRQQQSLEGFTFIRESHFLVGFRDSESEVQWTEIPQALFILFSNLHHGEVASVEDFAVACLEDSAAQSEEEKFRYFFDLFSTLLIRGAISAYKEP